MGRTKKRRHAGKSIWILFCCIIAFLIVCSLLLNIREEESGLTFKQLYFDKELSKYYGEIPNSLLGLMEKNPEAKDFVLNYSKYNELEPDRNLTKELEEGGIPLLLQWDERWGYETYGDDFLAINGCGPTCLSMVYLGLSNDDTWNPYEVAKMAEDEGYYVEGAGSLWSLMESGAETIGLTVHAVIFDEVHIRKSLKEGRPIICVMRPGDFTTSGHFIVLIAETETGDIIVRDPNSRVRSEMTWELEKLLPQIKNLWSYSYEG